MTTVTAIRDSTQDIVKQVDDNTIYNVTGDTNPTQALLEMIYPVGSIYIGTMSVCPLSALFGTWTLVSSGRVLQGADENHLPGTTIEAGLPNITSGQGRVLAWKNDDDKTEYITGSLKRSMTGTGGGLTSGTGLWLNSAAHILNASYESSIYGNSDTVQPPAFVVNIWRRVG